MLSRDEILRSATRRYVTVKDVPGWGDVCLRSLTDSERWAYWADRFADDGKNYDQVTRERGPRLLVMMIVDAETKDLVFQKDDWTALDHVPKETLDSLLNEAWPLSGCETKAAKAKGEVTDVDEQKKTGSSTSGDSPGSSPETTPPGPSDC